MHSYRELVRPVDNRKIAGVAAGVAEYFRIDPTIARILFVILFFVGPGLPLYLLLWLLIPRDTTSLANGGTRGTSLWSILFKAFVVLASIAMIAEVADDFEDFSVPAFIIGLAVGLFFVYRSISTAYDSGDAETSGGIHRSTSNKKIMGVFGGLGERFNIDATILRIIGTILLFVGFPVILPAYLIYGILAPKRDQRLIIELVR